MVILDASVILKWLLPEDGSGAALRLQDSHLKGEEHIVVPFLLFYEISNVLRYKEDIPDGELVDLFETLSEFEFSVMQPSFQELEEIMLYARAKHISVYDAVYVMLARKVGCNLVTADAQLSQRVNEPFVKMLE